MQTLADIGEDELIRRLVRGLKQDASVIAGPGDDCAVVQGSREALVLKTTAPDHTYGEPAPSHSTLSVVIGLVPPFMGVVSIIVALLYWRCTDCGCLLRSNGYEIPQYCAKCGSPTGA